MKRLFAVLFVSILILIPTLSILQKSGSANDEFPPDALPFFERGIKAVAASEFARAVDYFESARLRAPLEPRILFNEALTQSKIAGHQLRAIVLFNAYLEAAPHTADASAVRQEIKNLAEEVESFAVGLIAMIPPSLYSDFNWRDMTYLLALKGDVNAAQREASENLGFSIPGALALRGDFAAAMRLAQSFTSSDARQIAYGDIAYEFGVLDPDAARTAFELMLSNDCCSYYLNNHWIGAATELMRGYIKIGRTEDAVKTAMAIMPYVRKLHSRDYSQISDLEQTKGMDDFQKLFFAYRELAYLTAATARPLAQVLGTLPRHTITSEKITDALLERADRDLIRGDFKSAAELLFTLRNLSDPQREKRDLLLRYIGNPGALDDAIRANRIQLWTRYYYNSAESMTYDSPTLQKIQEEIANGSYLSFYIKASDLLRELYYVRKLARVRMCTLDENCDDGLTTQQKSRQLTPRELKELDEFFDSTAKE